MSVRRLSRQRAIQLLYSQEFAGQGLDFAEIERLFLSTDKLHRRGWGPFARSLARQTHERRDELDKAIRPTLKNWTLERLPVMDRLCLRMALCELVCFPDIPLRVTINEYIELARMYGDDESPVYVNAVLDRLAKSFPQKDFQAHGTAEEPPDEPRMDENAELPLIVAGAEMAEGPQQAEREQDENQE